MRYLIYALAAGIWLGAAVPGFAGKEMSIQIPDAPLREKPSAFGKVIGKLPYGERVEIVSEQNNWVEVTTTNGLSGWTHESILTKKKIELSAGDTDVNKFASGKEQAAAGKGFSAKVEDEYKARNENIDFGPIDEMEKRTFDDEEILLFLEDGGLEP